MSKYYILNAQGDPEGCSDLGKWARWFETGDRIVGQNTVGDARVSTVFLGLDHSFGGPRPLLWETLIFGGEHDGYQDRYSTRADALAGHAKALAMVQAKTE